MQIIDKDQKIVHKRDKEWDELVELWNYREKQISSKLESCNSLKMLDQIEKLLFHIDIFVAKLKEILIDPKGNLSRIYQEISMKEKAQSSDTMNVYFSFSKDQIPSHITRRSTSMANRTKSDSGRLKEKEKEKDLTNEVSTKKFHQLLVCVLSIIEALKAIYPVQDLLETKNFSQNWSQNNEVNETIKAIQHLKECINKEVASIDSTVERANTIFVSIEKISNLVTRSQSLFEEYSNQYNGTNNNNNNNNDTQKSGEKPENAILKVSRSLQSCSQFLSASVELLSEFPNLDGDPVNNVHWGNQNTKNDLKSAKIDQLIDYLISPLNGNSDLTKALDIEEVFLQTFDYFITPKDLLEKLFVRYCLSPTFFIPPKIEIAELPDTDGTKSNRQIPQRVRVLSFIRKWIIKYYKRDFHNSLITENLVNFLSNTASLTGNFFEAKTLLSELTKYEKIYSNSSRKSDLSPTITRINWENYSFLEISPREIAVQLTLYEYEIFKKMKVDEYLHQAWAKNEKDIKAPAIVKYTRHFNRISSWIVRSILLESDVEKRSQVIRRLIAVAMNLLQLNNFNGIFEILSGLRNYCIDRLKLSWNYVGPQMNEVKHRLATLMQNKMQLYRNIWEHSEGPALPYIGLSLTDLTYLEDGNPTFLADGSVNFFKFKKICESIRNLLKHQDTPYSYDRNQHFFDLFDNLEDFNVANEEAWAHRSNEIEPKSILEGVERYVPKFEEDNTTQYENLLNIINHPLVQESINNNNNNSTIASIETPKVIPENTPIVVQSEVETSVVTPTVTPETSSVISKVFDILEIEDLVGKMRATLQTKERRYRLKTLQNTFLASDAVIWVMDNVGLSKKDSIALCQQFLNNNHIQHALKENKRTFKDKASAYKFVDKIQFLREKSDSTPNLFHIRDHPSPNISRDNLLKKSLTKK